MGNNTTEAFNPWTLFNEVNDIFQWIILVPIVLSLFGNTTAIFVMRLPKNKGTVSGFLFLSLAISDLFVTFMFPVERWVLYTFHVGLYQFPNVGTIKNGLTLANADISSWILVLITIERVLCIYMPLKVKLIITLRRMKIVVLGLVVVLLTLYTVGTFMLMEVIADPYNFPIPQEKVKDGIMIVGFADLIIGFTIPYILILFGSILIVFKLKTRKMGKYSEQQNSVLMSVTMNLLAANLLFLLTTGPFTINAYINDFDPDHYVTWNIIWLALDLNSSLNFFVYVLSGKRFREDVKQLFGCCGSDRK